MVANHSNDHVNKNRIKTYLKKNKNKKKKHFKYSVWLYCTIFLNE